MENFKQDNRNSRNSFRSGSGDGKKFNNRDRSKFDMHKATCAKCGVSCEIPFKPTGERPVFCSNCFKNQGSDNRRSDRFRDKRHERPNFRDRQMHDVVCSKCGKDCQVPFKPTASKPVFCDDCFKQDGRNRGESKDSGKMIEQINLLNIKLDKLIEVLIPKVSVKKIKKPKVKKVAIKKIVKTKKAKVKAKVKPKVIKAKK